MLRIEEEKEEELSFWHVVDGVGWSDYEPEKRLKKRYRSYKRGFGRSRYAAGKPAGSKS